MKRREFITVLGGISVGRILSTSTARAQQRTIPVVGFLNVAAPDRLTGEMNAFFEGLHEAGYVEGHNVTVEYRWLEGHNERMPAAASDLVRRQVAVIAAPSGAPAALAAKAAISTIPIVFLVAVDPVAIGLAASLNRPGGNLTGITTLNVGVASKRLELLHQLIPTLTAIALLVNPTNAANTETTVQDLQSAAHTLRLDLHVFHASSEDDLEKAFAAMAALRVGGLVIGTDGFFISRSEQLAMLALRYSLPAVFQYRAFAAAGGLMSYGSNFSESYRQVGVYTGRILNGEKAAELPIVQSTKVELIINLKTAKALNLSVPLPLLGRVDEVIE